MKNNKIYVIEVNPRASRTIAFISKIKDIPYAKYAAQIACDTTIDKLDFYTNETNLIAVKLKFAVKPTCSILSTRKTIDKFGKNTSISVKGRHDPCVGIRAVPIGEAMMHCVLLDHYLMNKAQCGN